MAAPLFNGTGSGLDFYFAHNYSLVCDDSADVVARTAYGAGCVAAVQSGSVLGVQFHPGKSHKLGLHRLRNFLPF